MSPILLIRPRVLFLAAAALSVLAAMAGVRDDAPGVARAQSPPPYDDFNNRDHWWNDCCSGSDIFPLDRTYATAGATLEPGEGAPCAVAGATVWIDYTADRSGRLFLDANGSDFDAVLAVYTWDTTGDFLPSPPGAKLQPVGCNDDTPGADANFSFEIQRNTQYFIQIGGRSGASGTARLRATCACRPPNDDFMDGLQEIFVNSYQQETTRGVATERATLQPGEPQPCAAIGATVWYTLFTDTPSRVELSTTGSSFDTVLAVYALPGATEWPPKFSDLHTVACEDSGTGPASLTLDTELYQQYFVQVGGARGASGQLTLTARCDPVCPPYNDSSLNAEWWEPPAEACCVSTAGATLEEGEPRACGGIGATVWYRVTVRGDTTLVIDSEQSDFETVLAVHEPTLPSPPGTLDLVDCSASTASRRARVEFRAKANLTYLLQAGGRDGATGMLAFNIDCEPMPCPPPHDSIVNPIWFDKPYGEPYEEVHDVRGATVEDGEPLDCGAMGHTTWWVIDMYPDRGSIPFVFDTKNSSMETAIAVYEAPVGALQPDGTWGIEFSDLMPVACDFQGEGTRAVSRFSADSGPVGRRYYVQTGGRGGASGELHVTISCDGGCPPDNDNVAQAYYAPVGYEQFTDTRRATVEPGESLPCGNIGRTIWYRLDGAMPGGYRVTTAGSDFATVIAAYRSDGVSPSGGVVDLGCHAGSTFTLDVESGFAYYIQLGGVDGAGGGLRARVDCVVGCEPTSPLGGGIGPSGSVAGPDTGSGGYLSDARR